MPWGTAGSSIFMALLLLLLVFALNGSPLPAAQLPPCISTLIFFFPFFFRKIRAPIKIKSALPPPPPRPPPKKEEFYGHGFSCRKNAFFPGVHKIGAPISGPRIADTNFTDTRIFLTFGKLRESFKVIFNLAGYSYFARLFLETPPGNTL